MVEAFQNAKYYCVHSQRANCELSARVLRVQVLLSNSFEVGLEYVPPCACVLSLLGDIVNNWSDHHSSDPFRVKTLKVVRVSDHWVITSEILVPKLSSRRLWDITVHEIIQHTVVNTDTENASLAKGVHHHDFLPPFEKRKVDGRQELHHGAPTKRLHQSAILPHRHHKGRIIINPLTIDTRCYFTG